MPDMYGLCSARKNIDGKFYSMVYGHPCSINLDPIEKKPLYHYYPGQGILSIGTFGCNLFCKGCQNFDITRIDRKSEEDLLNKLKYYSPKEIINLALKNHIKLIAYTYNEPTTFFEYMIDIAKLAKKEGIKNVIVSNGYINPKPLKELCKYIDAANIDLKGINERFYTQYSHAHIQPVLNTIKILHKNKVWLELTNLLIEGLNDNPKDIKKLCDWIKTNVGTNVPLHFSRFYPYYQASHISSTNPEALENAKKIAVEAGLNYVYLGNLGMLDNTYCTKCRNILVQRNNINIDINTNGLIGKKKDKCSKCGNILPGIFE
jgi:pyruvate formate lyase activating enzyme